MRISDWSSYVCSSDLTKRSGRRFQNRLELRGKFILARAEGAVEGGRADGEGVDARLGKGADAREAVDATGDHESAPGGTASRPLQLQRVGLGRSEEHTSELQSLMRISYAVFCLKK